MVQTRSKSGKKRSRVKKERGCNCCEEKTKCSNLKINQNGKSEIHNFINYKDSNTKISKKPPCKRGGSPITTSGVLQRRNSGNLEGGRSSEQCVKMVDDWLKNFQIEKSPMEERSIEEPSTSTSSPPQHAEYEEQSQGALSPMDAAGPPSVGSSSISAPSPASSGDASYCQGASSSAASQVEDEQPDSTGGTARPTRTPERREKQRLASAKSRKKKKAEEDVLQQKADQLTSDNARLQGMIQGMEAERKRYLSGEFPVDDKDVFDPEEPHEDQPAEDADPGASS